MLSRYNVCGKLRTHVASAGGFSVIRVYDEAGNVIETHEHKAEFKEF
jgi:hypothetical protein